jgi:hypothetical protein
VHDPETLEYFFVEVDRLSGIPALPQMVVDGVEIPEPSTISKALKQRAAALIEDGPPTLESDHERRIRYFISDLLDDLRAPRSRDELIATGAKLYEQLADWYLRRRRLWSAKGKAIPRVLRQADPILCRQYLDAFDDLFVRGNPESAISLSEDLLRDAGGVLFEGYRAEAPSAWRAHRVIPS